MLFISNVVTDKKETLATYIKSLPRSKSRNMVYSDGAHNVFVQRFVTQMVAVAIHEVLMLPSWGDVPTSDENHLQLRTFTVNDRLFHVSLFLDSAGNRLVLTLVQRQGKGSDMGPLWASIGYSGSAEGFHVMTQQAGLDLTSYTNMFVYTL